MRLVAREVSPDEKVNFCFADFESTFHTTLVINTLQGYRFDKDDIWGLQLSYASKQTNVIGQHSRKNDGPKESNLKNNNNNSNANQRVSGSGHSPEYAP